MRELVLRPSALNSASNVTDPRGHLVPCVDWMQHQALAIPLSLALKTAEFAEGANNRGRVALINIDFGVQMTDVRGSYFPSQLG